MINREVLNKLKDYMHRKRALVLLGARRTGKTTILKALAENGTHLKYVDCDLSDSLELFNFHNIPEIQLRFGGYRYLLIDEAQRIPDIGLKMKAIIDNLPDLQVIATGSSSLEIANRTHEPLTGRKFEFFILPLSTSEIFAYDGYEAVTGWLGTRLIYGNYPEVYLEKTMPDEIIKEIAGSYLFKDILSYQDVKRPELLRKLLQALALQMGSEVSMNELAQTVGLDRKTVERYIGLLEQIFIIFRLYSYSRNLRNELKRAQKVYFWDNGVRNALLNNFNPLNLRTDTGALWENYFVSEMRKMRLNQRANCDHYFWRTTLQKEIDLIEVEAEKVTAFEIKWNPAKPGKLPLAFRKAYPEARFITVNPENYLEHLGV